MRTSTGTRLKPRLFYGWWLVLAGFAIVAYGAGATKYVAEQLADLIRDEFGGSISQVAFLGLSGIVGGVVLLAIGPLIDRWGPRRLMLIGIPMVGIGFLGLSFAPNLLTLYIIQVGLIGVGMSAGFLLPVQTATANWFVRRRSIALAAISAAPVIGRALTNLLEQVIAGQFPWSSIFLGLGLVMLAIGIPLALAIRHRPEQHGYLPDGGSAPLKEAGEPAAQQSAGVTEVNFTLRQALLTRTFWMLAFAMGLGNGAAATAQYLSNSLLLERGLTHQVATLDATIIPFTGLVGFMLFGYLGDLFPKRYLLALAFAIQSLSVVILLIGGAAIQVLLYPLVFGLGSGTVPLILAVRADYFGPRAFATITVAAMLVSGIVSSIIGIQAPFLLVFGVWLQDTVGSSTPVFLLPILIGLVAASVFYLTRPPVPPQDALPPAGL